jgi:serine/threonine-protein kinase
MAIVLRIVSGPQSGRALHFEGYATVLIGRAAGAQLVLADDPEVGPQHARLEVNPPRCRVVDLGSGSGTFVNGQRTQAADLRPGDRVRVGRTELEVGLENETPRADPQQTEACPTRPAAPCAVPGYDIVRELGRGGMGVVYQAVQKATGRTVAVKVLIPAQEAPERALQTFLREASVLSQLNHPRIVRFHEVGMAGGQLFLVMEYVETVNLKAILAPQPAAARVRTVCAITCQALEALAYAHGRSLVHRDVKPENLLVTRAGMRLRTKLADFGLAKNFAHAGCSGITPEGEACGTAVFAPPELILDCRCATPAADLYGVGATLYTLLSDRLPYDFARAFHPFGVILRDEPIPLAGVRPDLPAGLAAVVHRALAKEPAARFATANEMRRALLPFARRPGA